MVQVLQDLGVDFNESECGNSLVDNEGVDLLADTILAGISSWLMKIDIVDQRRQLWYEDFLEVVQLIRRPRSADLLPNSYTRATSTTFTSLIPMALGYIMIDMQVDIPVETSQDGLKDDDGQAPAEESSQPNDLEPEFQSEQEPELPPDQPHPDVQDRTEISADYTDSGSAEHSNSSSKGVFALIIGINNYLSTEDFNPLRGAVNDARAFKQYLLEPREKRGLGVPEKNIVMIEDLQATRKNILATFRSHFLENKNIPDHGSTTMILFYAGHGTRMEAPDNLGTADGKVEAICPVDERTKDAAGKYVHTIPDYILGWLLRELANTKGPNITVICDSCHAGGVGREIGVARNASSLSPHVPIDLDSHLWRGKTATAQAHSMWEAGATSHVLLAACREDETAREIRYTDKSVHGRFTESLIFQLRRARATLETITRSLFPDALVPQWSGQTPHCGGERRNCLVFDGNYPATGKRALPLTLHKAPPQEATAPEPEPESVPGRELPEVPAPLVDSYRVEMGSVEGVVPGTEFDMRAADNTFLGKLTARFVQINHSILAPPDQQPLTLPPGACAVVSRWVNPTLILRVYTPPDFPYTADLFPPFVSHAPHGQKYVQAPAREGAGIALRTEADGALVIERLTCTLLECHRETRVDLGGNVARLPAVGVTLEMHRLVGAYPGRKPDRTCGRDANLVDKHEGRFALERNARYGFTIRNEEPEDLFPYLFYFDPVKYTIHRWYSPAGIHVRAPLKKNGGAVTVGVGGELAFQFALPPGEKGSSGFIKLFVATTFIDLDWMKQTVSPFDRKVPKWDAYTVGLIVTDESAETAA
ncbi:caspase domain-containing protein [Mycena latifolia]|nr:caspase domain-containing protein [Mycena latifolia]